MDTDCEIESSTKDVSMSEGSDESQKNKPQKDVLSMALEQPDNDVTEAGGDESRDWGGLCNEGMTLRSPLIFMNADCEVREILLRRYEL